MADQKTWQRGWHVQDNTDEVYGQLRVDGDEGSVCILGTREKDFTPDAERHDMAALIAAAPEMLTVLKEINRYLDAPHNYTIEGQRGIVRAVAAVLAKAEPPRKVKHDVWVTVKVEIEADTGTSYEVIRRRASESVYTAMSPGVTFKEKKVAGARELYEVSSLGR